MFLAAKRCVALLISLLGLTFGPASQAQEPVPAVATFSILGDMVKNVGGERLKLTVLVGPGGDSHVYSPSAADARAVKSAAILFENGLDFEGWMTRLAKSSGTKARKVVASEGITALKADDHEGHGHGVDPHAWQDVGNAKIYVTNIRNALISTDPGGKAIYEANTNAYLARLDALDQKIRAAVAAIPSDRRKVITSHDAFGYFAKAYGVEIIGLQGISSDSEVSAKDIAAIIRQIKAEKIPAIFVETISDPRLMNRISKETGVKVGTAIYSDTLSDSNGPARTYIEMMEHNIKALEDALAP